MGEQCAGPPVVPVLLLYRHRPREFVRTHPVATKRALRAILKATDVCALEPERAAQRIVEKGFTPRYDYALQTMQEIPYNRWRETIRRTRCASTLCACTRSA